jgi:hypothetical protein
MKRLLVLLALLGAGVFGYQHYRSRPVAQYEAFAEAVLHREYDRAEAMSSGLTAQELERLGSQERIGGGPPMFQKLFPSRFAIESEEQGADGTVTVKAMQTVLFNPAGVESAVRPAMYATLHQVVELKKVAGDWKVASFQNELRKMDSLSGR